MIKIIFTSLVLLMAAGCDRAPAPGRASQAAAPFTVLSERPDAQTGALVIDMKIEGPTTESNVKEIAEGVIADRKGQYSNITVRSYLAGPEPGALPYCVSKTENNSVTHRINQQGATHRIPTH